MKYILLLLGGLLSTACFGQGFNNDYNFDNEDIKFLFEKNGLEVFKFQFMSRSKKSVNIIGEEYSAHQIKRTINFYEDFGPMMALLDEPVAYFFPPLNDSIAQTPRFYLVKEKANLSITVNTSKIQRGYDFKLKGIKLTQSRAFDNIPTMLSNRQPLFVFYGNRKADLIACPGDAPVDDIIQMYDYVLVFYADIFIPH